MRVEIQKTPWTNKAWRRHGQELQEKTGCTLRGAMRRIALTHVSLIKKWEGDWSKALEIFESRTNL
jgi:hypothetical protein